MYMYTINKDGNIQRTNDSVHRWMDRQMGRQDRWNQYNPPFRFYWSGSIMTLILIRHTLLVLWVKGSIYSIHSRKKWKYARFWELTVLVKVVIGFANRRPHSYIHQWLTFHLVKIPVLTSEKYKSQLAANNECTDSIEFISYKNSNFI